MSGSPAMQERFLRDPLPVQLGGIASNLNRIRTYARREASQTAVQGLLEESKWFIEWSAAEVEIDVADYLVWLQVELARWQLQLSDRWQNPADRERLSNQAGAWSQRVLELSGLQDR